MKARLGGSDSDSRLPEQVTTSEITETEIKRKENISEDEIGMSDERNIT